MLIIINRVFILLFSNMFRLYKMLLTDELIQFEDEITNKEDFNYLIDKLRKIEIKYDKKKKYQQNYQKKYRSTTKGKTIRHNAVRRFLTK